MSNLGFWGKLQKPILVLAPLADVTDPAFRRIIAKYGKPDVMWTEFVSADGLFLATEEGKEKIKKDLLYTEEERPIIAQFFTSRPEMMFKAAAHAVECGFDGVDINMGCPDRSVEKQKAGAALIKDPERAQEIVRAAKEGVASMGSTIPVSVKTRIGYNTNEIETWLPSLLEVKPAVVTIHARTRKEMSKVPARWEEVRRAVAIRDDLNSETLIFGNGDAVDLGDARKKAQESGCDGVMLGRAIFGNPWLFSSSQELKNKEDQEVREKVLRVLVEHTKLFEELLPHKNFAIMKKHYKAYVHGFDGAKELRMELMDAQSAREIEKTIEEYLKSLVL